MKLQRRKNRDMTTKTAPCSSCNFFDDSETTVTIHLRRFHWPKQDTRRIVRLFWAHSDYNLGEIRAFSERYHAFLRSLNNLGIRQILKRSYDGVKHSGLLDFFILSNVWFSKRHKGTQCFGNTQFPKRSVLLCSLEYQMMEKNPVILHIRVSATIIFLLPSCNKTFLLAPKIK
jgi:hypothetical protein